MEDKKLVIIGASKGADLIIKSTKYEIAGILDDFSQKPRLGVPVIGKISNMEDFDKDKYVFILSVSKMGFRRETYNKYKDDYTFINIIRSDFIFCDRIGTGNIIFPNVVCDLFSTIGDNNVISTGTVINHHNLVGSGNLFGPGCLFSGSVVIGNNCTFGSGIVIQPGVTIGDNVNIASGCVIVKNVLSNMNIKAKQILGSPIYKGEYDYIS